MCVGVVAEGRREGAREEEREQKVLLSLFLSLADAGGCTVRLVHMHPCILS